MPRPRVFGFQRADALSGTGAVLAVLDNGQVDWSSTHAEADPSQEEEAEGLEQHHLSLTPYSLESGFKLKCRWPQSSRRVVRNGVNMTHLKYNGQNDSYVQLVVNNVDINSF